MALHLDSEDSINARDQGASILLKMFEVLLSKLAEEEFSFALRHGFDHKSFVVTEEEEAAACSACLACLKDIRPVSLLVK
jgi:hypothetical protein